MNLKRKLGLIIPHLGFIGRAIQDINQAIFHWDERQHYKTFGKLNPDIKFFVVRGNNLMGLLALYLNNLPLIYDALEKGFIPCVDFKNYKTQYNIDSPVNGTFNAWDYYFEQPSNYELEEIYRSKNVILSGWKFYSLPQKNMAPVNDSIMREMIKRVPIKKYIYDIAENKIKSDGIDKMIGILVRGTDYIKLRPIGHPIPPTPENAASKLDEFIAKYGQHKIFLATEDENIYNFFVKRYGDLIYTSDNNLVKYAGTDYLYNEINSSNKYKFGLDYLVKMICLSRCKFLIASRTAGTNFARLLNNNSYIDEYIFNLGNY